MKYTFLKAFLISLFCIGIYLSLPQGAHAAVKTWNPAACGSTSWNTAGNWDGGLPGTVDIATFDSATSNCNVTIDTTIDVAGINITNSYTGTITQGNGNDVNIRASGYTQNASGSTFTGGDNTSDMDLNGGAFALTSGSFTAPAGSITTNNSWNVSGTFTANGGTLSFGNANSSISPSTETYNNVNFNGNGRTYDIVTGKTFKIGGTLGVNATNSNLNGPGIVTVQGDILHNTNNGLTGDAVITVNGTGTQNWSGGSGGSVPGLKIDKATGTFYIKDSEAISAGGWEYVQGTVDATTYTSAIRISAGNRNMTITGNTTFYDLSKDDNCATSTIASGTTVTVAHTLTLGWCGNFIDGPGTIVAQGNIDDSDGHGGYGNVSITLTGTNNQTITYTGTTSFPSGTFTINKASGTVTMASELPINHTGQDLILTSGTLNLAGFNLTVDDQFTIGADATFKLQGGETIPTIASIASGSTVEYTGAGTYSSLIAGSSYSSLTISGSGSFTPASNVTVTGSFTQSAGTFSVAPSGMTVSQNFTHSGGVFTPGSSTVTFDNSGYTSSISGTTTFYNLTSIIPSKTLQFVNSSTTTVSNALTLRGSSDGLLTLKSTADGYPWSLVVNGTATLSKLSVRDSNACGGTTNPLEASGSVSVSNNSCWTISGGYTDWYNKLWTKRRAINIDGSKVIGTQTDFPILVKLSSDTSLATYAQDDNDDILITSEDGTTKLSHEIEKFDGATGELILWVKVPTISNGTNTRLFMYYGNASATSQQDTTNVWDSNFKSVWHLEETSGTTHTDSTTNTNTGNKVSATEPNPTTGITGGGQSFDGSNDYVSTTNSFVNPDEITISAWINTSSSNGRKILGFESNQTGTGSVSYDRDIDIGNDGKAYATCYDGVDRFAISTSTVNDSAWHYIVGTISNTGNYVKLYFDGQLQDTTTCANPENYTGYYRMGSYKTSGSNGAHGYITGLIDEARVSSTPRSASWIETEYNNQSSPLSFATLSTENSLPITNVHGGAKIYGGTRIHAN
ncbi:MAG: DUF2341 domain-containing protein [Candidatus Saccharibacteria bacterium]|nr:DUF2341 domain-containing protein [Candidatus Saccharibacteria bacterium]